MKTSPTDNQVLKVFPRLSLNTSQLSIEIELCQPGLLKWTLTGYVQSNQLAEFFHFITEFQQKLLDNQGTYVLLIDTSGSVGISLKVAQQMLAKIRWGPLSQCLEVEYISAQGLLNQVVRMLFRLNPHKIPLKVHPTLPAALTAAQNLLVSIQRTQTGELSEMPSGYRYEALTDHDYQDKAGNRHRFYLIDDRIVLLQAERAVRTESMLKLLASQQYIGESLRLPPEFPKYMIVDLSQVRYHDELSRKSIRSVADFFKLHPSLYKLSFVITPPRLRGILKIISHLAPILRHRIVPIDSVEKALDFIDKRQVQEQSDTLPRSKKALQALVRQQKQNINRLQQEQSHFSELLSQVFTRLVIDTELKLETHQPGDHASLAHEEAIDILNYVQLDMQDILSRLQSQILIREEAENKARASEQVKSQFLANMSHEMRTPMNAILGFSQLILKRYPGQLPEPVELYIERIQENGQQLLILINDVLDLARIESGRIEIQKKPVDMQQFLPQILGQFESLRQGRTLRLEIPDPAPIIVTDEQKLRQILSNLLGNALKFTPITGSITLALSETSDHYKIEVIDTGIGIPLDQQTLIFERFTQVEHPEQKWHRGTGLGLSISKSMAECMGYQLKVSSKPHQGSTFYLIIPFSTF